MASDCLDSDFIDSDLFYWAHSHIDEAAITGRVDDTIEEEREELMKKRFEYLALRYDDTKFILKPFGDDSIRFKVLAGFATHTSQKMRNIEFAGEDTIQVTVPCDANALNLMVRFWMNLYFRMSVAKPLLENAQSETGEPVHAQNMTYLESVLGLATIIEWAEDEAIEDTICAEVRRKLTTDDIDAVDLMRALPQLYNPPDEQPVARRPVFDACTGKYLIKSPIRTAFFKRLLPILLSSLLRNHDRIACGFWGDDLRRMKSAHPTLAYDIDMGLIWWHQRQMAELRGAG